jgi:hypothetical protein
VVIGIECCCHPASSGVSLGHGEVVTSLLGIVRGVGAYVLWGGISLFSSNAGISRTISRANVYYAKNHGKSMSPCGLPSHPCRRSLRLVVNADRAYTSRDLIYTILHLSTSQSEEDAFLRDVLPLGLLSLHVLRGSAVGALDLGTAPTTVVVLSGVSPTSTAETVLYRTPRPLLVPAGDLDVVDDILEGSGSGRDIVVRRELQLSGKYHLHGADQSHGRIITRGVRIAVGEVGAGNKCGQTSLVATGVETSLLT